MVRRSRSYIRLGDDRQKQVILAERAQVVKMVAHFDRKQIKDTHWHKTLVRLDAALEKLEGDQKDG